MLMASIDGIQNKIHPGDAMDKNLYDLPERQSADVCHSLEAPIGRKWNDFLTQGDVFPKDLIEVMWS